MEAPKPPLTLIIRLFCLLCPTCQPFTHLLKHFKLFLLLSTGFCWLHFFSFVLSCTYVSVLSLAVSSFTRCLRQNKHNAHIYVPHQLAWLVYFLLLFLLLSNFCACSCFVLLLFLSARVYCCSFCFYENCSVRVRVCDCVVVVLFHSAIYHPVSHGVSPFVLQESAPLFSMPSLVQFPSALCFSRCNLDSLREKSSLLFIFHASWHILTTSLQIFCVSIFCLSSHLQKPNCLDPNDILKIIGN